MVLNGQDESRKAWQQGLSPMQEIGGTERGIQACAAVLSRLFGAVSTLESIAPGRGTSSYSEGEDWKTLESKWANYYRKQKPPEELGSFVEAIMKLEKEWISHLPPERQKHAIGISIELTGVLSERKDRKRAGIAEPVVNLKHALAEARESVKQVQMKACGATEEQAEKRADAYLKREEKEIGKMRAEGFSDQYIAEIISDCNEADHRYLAKLDAKAHERSASLGQATKAKTPEEAAQEFAKQAPKLPTDPQELAKRPTGHPDGHFHPGSTGATKGGMGTRGRGLTCG